MRSSYHKALYWHKFFNKPILSCVQGDPCAFSPFDLNPGSLIASLRWGSLVMDRRSLYYPDVVRQFYTNLKIEGSSVLCGVFSTYIDGHRLLITPKLLADVLRLPTFGFSLFCEDEFPKVNFDPSPILSCWTGVHLQSHDLIEVAALPDALQVLHYFITSVFLPRSEAKFLVTGLDTWIMRCAQLGKPLDYSCLMFASIVAHSDPRCTDQLPFAPEISFLVAAIGVRLDHKYLSLNPIDVPVPLSVLKSLGSRRVKGSGGDSELNIDDLADDVCFDLVLSDDCLDESTLVPSPITGM
ncbi:hypothetical protein LINGRAPRIM_LOCUS2061 [Linum grandiflorum]